MTIASAAAATSERQDLNSKASRMAYEFHWRCGYMNCVYYMVYGDGQPYEAEVRRGISDYERSIYNYNGDPTSFDRNCTALINTFRGRACDPVKPEVVKAFNTWRAEEHAKQVDKLRANPERYGLIADNDPLITPPPVVRGVWWNVTNAEKTKGHWVFLD